MSIHCRTAHGAKTRQPITFCIGTRSISRSRSRTIHQQTHQSSTPPLRRELIEPLPRRLKHLRLSTPAKSMSFSTLGEGPLPQKAQLIPWISCHVKSLSPRRISSLINNRSQSMRESQMTMKPSNRQTYLLRLPTTSLIQASLATAPSPSTPLLLSRKTRNSSLPPPTIRPS
jgi:hypothetical protein